MSNFIKTLDNTFNSEILALEERLRSAQLNADIATLNELISENLLFSGPNGELATKSQDIEAYREKIVRFLRHEPEEIRVRRIGNDVAIVSLCTKLTVEVSDEITKGLFRYTRVWARENGAPWQVVGGHVSEVIS